MLDVPELDVCSDIPRVVVAVRKYHAESNVKSSRRIMLHAYRSHALIEMRTDETIFSYHKRYLESMRKLVDSGFTPLDDDMEAIKFVESLPSEMFGEWQASLVNREHDAQITGDAESPWPRTVNEAHTIATSRVSTFGRSKKRYDIDMPTISTVNKAVGRGADSQGRGGGTRLVDDEKTDHKVKGRTHADKPEELPDEAKECEMCEGAFNYMSKGKRHWLRYCPLLSISPKKKAEIFSNLLSGKAKADEDSDTSKDEVAKAAVRRHKQKDYDSDDSDDYAPRYAVIMGGADK